MDSKCEYGNLCRVTNSQAGPPAGYSSPSGSGYTGSIESADNPQSALTTSDGIIYGADGSVLSLQGVAWYGFDNGTSLNGLQVRLACAFSLAHLMLLKCGASKTQWP